MTIAHAQLLTEDGDFTVAGVPNENRTLRWPNHDCGIFALVYETLCYVLMNVELAIIAEVNCEVFSIQLTW